MSLLLEASIPPPHLLQSRSASWSSPYIPQHYPAPASSPAPMSPQSLHSYMSQISESPLPSHEVNSLPTSGWYGPSIPAPECHSEVCISPLLRVWLLICGCPDQLRLIFPLYDPTHVDYQPFTTRDHLLIFRKNTDSNIRCYLSKIRLLQRLSGSRVNTPLRRASIRYKKRFASVQVSFEEAVTPNGASPQQ
jgi:hypothetical protein